MSVLNKIKNEDIEKFTDKVLQVLELEAEFRLLRLRAERNKRERDNTMVTFLHVVKRTVRSIKSKQTWIKIYLLVHTSKES